VRNTKGWRPDRRDDQRGEQRELGRQPKRNQNVERMRPKPSQGDRRPKERPPLRGTINIISEGIRRGRMLLL